MKTTHASTRRSNAYFGQMPSANDSRNPKPLKRWEGGVAVNAGASPILDVRFLCVAIDYPYMFSRKQASLQIERQWAAAFTLTCLEVDSLLGSDKRGFCWKQLDIANGAPQWHWTLARGMEQQGAIKPEVPHSCTSHGMDRSTIQSELRQVIQPIVENGMRRAVFFNQDASNSGDMQ
jgi:hypothetical protein